MLSSKEGDEQARAELLGKLLADEGEKPYLLMHGAGRTTRCLILAPVSTEEIGVLKSGPLDPTIITFANKILLPLQLKGREPVGFVDPALYDLETRRWTKKVSLQQLGGDEGGVPIEIPKEKQMFPVSLDGVDLSPEEAIIFNTHLLGPWPGYTGWAQANCFSSERHKKFMRLIVDEPNRANMWVYRLSQTFDLGSYPILVFQYRASNVNRWSTKSALYFSLRKGAGKSVKILSDRDIISDGKVHEVRKDLRELGAAGLLDYIAVGTMSEAGGPGTLDVYSLRFEAESGKGREIKQAIPITVAVTDSLGKPVEGARVTLDPEWVNIAESGTTDFKGSVVLHPRGDGSIKHSILVEKKGLPPAQKVWAGDGAQRLSIRMKRSAQYGGIVLDEEGKPLPGACINFETVYDVAKQDIVNRNFSFSTDNEGRWRSGILPSNLNRVMLKIAHPDHPYESYSLSLSRPQMASIRNRALIVMLDSGVILKAQVVTEAGSAVAEATIKLQGESGRTSSFTLKTDWEGRFDFIAGKNEALVLTVQKEGMAVLGKRLMAHEGMEPLRLVVSETSVLR